jgi:hypothetical protein
LPSPKQIFAVSSPVFPLHGNGTISAVTYSPTKASHPFSREYYESTNLPWLTTQKKKKNNNLPSSNPPHGMYVHDDHGISPPALHAMKLPWTASRPEYICKRAPTRSCSSNAKLQQAEYLGSTVKIKINY